MISHTGFIFGIQGQNNTIFFQALAFIDTHNLNIRYILFQMISLGIIDGQHINLIR